jgi:SAM-dependent methyltransferase
MRTKLGTTGSAGKTVIRSAGTGAVASLRDADAMLAPSLENLDQAGNYAAWILELAAPHLGNKVLEVGAGHGTFTALLARQDRQVVASELSGRCIGKLRVRFAGTPSVQVLHGGIPAAAPHGPFDAVILINVLEHIDDDDGALRDIAAVLKPCGRVILWVPALPVLYSEFDRSIGHYRRYRMAALRRQLHRAGYEVREIRYVNVIGAIAWLVVARFLRRSPNCKASVRLFDRYFVPVMATVERMLRPPFGQSLFTVAVRRDRPLRPTC